MMDRQITFQSFTVSAGTLSADETKTWQAISEGTVWAKRQHLKGREMFAAQQVNPEITTRFTIRHRSDLNPKMRIKDEDDGRFYNIAHVIEIRDRDSFLEILASARHD